MTRLVRHSQAAFDDLLTHDLQEFDVSESFAHLVRKDQSEAAKFVISLVRLIDWDSASVEPLDVYVEAISIHIIKTGGIKEVRQDPLWTACGTSVVVLGPLFHTILMQIVSTCLAVRQGLDQGIKIFVTDDAPALNVFTHGLELVLEEGGLLAKHVLVCRKLATLWAYM
jgi:hypothetical protein